MKKIIGWGLATAMALLAANAGASNIIYDQALVNSPALASTQTYVLDAMNAGIGGISAHAVYSSATVAADTFKDGQQSTGSFTVVNYANLASNAWFSLNGRQFTNGNQWTASVSNAATAISIAGAINASTSGVSGIVSAGAQGGVVTATSTYQSAYVYFPLATSDSVNLTVNSPVMTGGSASAVALNSAVINIPSHGLPINLAVLYTTASTAGTLNGLGSGSTYYVYPVDSNDIELMLYSSNALLGLQPSVITSTNTQPSAHTYTLTPLGITGTPGFYWQESNDNSNWYTIATTSVTMGPGVAATPYSLAKTNFFWSFAQPLARYFKLSVVGPITGAIQMTMTIVGTN